MDRLNYEGLHNDTAVCGMKVHRPEGKPVVIILHELDENPAASITNRAERAFYLAWFCAGRPVPCTFIECYRGNEFSLVTFEFDTGMQRFILSNCIGGGKNHGDQFRNPNWQPVTEDQVFEMSYP